MDRWLSVKDAAEYTGRHPETIRDALRMRDLRGFQRSKHASWRTKESWCDEWLMGEAKAA